MNQKECLQSIESLQREFEEYVYIVSHDLKAPLRAIANLSQWIMEDLSALSIPEETIQHISLLQKRVERLQHMINALRTYSRVSRYDLVLESFDLEKELRQITSTLTIPAATTINGHQQIPAFRTYRQKLSMVLHALLDNAIKHHHRDDGHIIVDVLTTEEDYIFQVRDDGPGIPKTIQDKVFNIFYSQASDEDPSTIGSGLSFARKIVEFVGGNIRLCSRAGKGTHVIFSWPKTIRSRAVVPVTAPTAGY